MTYTLTDGIEIETYGASIPVIRRAFESAGILGCEIKPDGTPRVDAEIVLPPLAPCDFAWDYIKKICRVLEEVGASVNSSCGLHVHIGNAPLIESASATRFCGDSIRVKDETGRFIVGQYFQEPMDFIAVQDIMKRYTRQQDAINSMFPRSRTDNRYCTPLSTRRIEQASTISELTFGKFTSINLQTWSRGTIEFRQASGTIEASKIINWVKFLNNLVSHTLENRIESGNRTIVTDTPEQPFRRGARVGVQYDMMRSDGGATTQEIMDATGCSEQRVRAAVSEIRTRVGDAAVVTSTQQANGARYGDGTHHTSYTVLFSIETQGNAAQLLPENRRGVESIWANVEDDLFEWWQNRITTLSDRNRIGALA
tara:strand:+ start:87 stop:1193 length:1107 start_codon:yes stop_codon:yes gene_type:complete